MLPPEQVLATILKHDNKQTSYKFALLHAINDVVLSYPDIGQLTDVAIPLRRLAEFWIAYYWPFVHSHSPIYQGARAQRAGGVSQDMSFRNDLRGLRNIWETVTGIVSSPAEGFFVIHELRLKRNRELYPKELCEAYSKTLKSVAKAIEKPIQYAGPREWSIFDKPRRYHQIVGDVTPIPRTDSDDLCIVVNSALWHTFQQLSLWVEALCIHEWCLFTERVAQDADQPTDRGNIYVLLTARPNNRRPLTWERNEVDLLLMEGHNFTCPWTQKLIKLGTSYDLDHLIPVSIYPINELWNLAPSDPNFNSHQKRNLLPTLERLHVAKPILEQTYGQYLVSATLRPALYEDASSRFSSLDNTQRDFPRGLAMSVVRFLEQMADSRNLGRF